MSEVKRELTEKNLNQSLALKSRVKLKPRDKGKFIVKGKEPLSKQVIGIRLPVSLHKIVYQQPNRTEWLRKVIAEAVEKERENISSIMGGKS